MKNKEIAQLAGLALIVKSLVDLDRGKDDSAAICMALGFLFLEAGETSPQGVTNYTSYKRTRRALVNNIQISHTSNTSKNHGQNNNELPVSVSDKPISIGSSFGIDSCQINLPVKVQLKNRLSLAGFNNKSDQPQNFFHSIRAFLRSIFSGFRRVFNFRHKHKNKN